MQIGGLFWFLWILALLAWSSALTWGWFPIHVGAGLLFVLIGLLGLKVFGPALKAWFPPRAVWPSNKLAAVGCCIRTATGDQSSAIPPCPRQPTSNRKSPLRCRWNLCRSRRSALYIHRASCCAAYRRHNLIQRTKQGPSDYHGKLAECIANFSHRWKIINL